ncbi:MerR family transcriptional regulator [Streptomyces qinzhouensis]|uniref:MerR family transcriptional regulator n=1 Tax=Streptomyces qinzhouensis TaxID=2599401 RepID=A0A5B8J7Z0_9ACTN|nr:MerR family transcriptional regulator [Streptomyces qinzhouensis]QDY76524.1 MerR family transcriptional regulator [Streptomyces qinzhouensis]
MRIGEVAALVGVTPRTVRHYHHLGLFPEPGRLSNGYRDYGLRHAVVLARIRRLTELGLGLAEVRDVLADDAGRELVEVLEELDEDLARQAAELTRRRTRLAGLIARAREGGLPVEGPVSPELAGLLGALPPGESAMAAKDRGHLALLDTVLAQEERERLFAALAPLADGGRAARIHELYERLDALADADPGDPRIVPLGDALAACMPDELIAALSEGPLPSGSDTFGRAFLDDFPPAQSAVVHRMLSVLDARRRELPGEEEETA